MAESRAPSLAEHGRQRLLDRAGDRGTEERPFRDHVLDQRDHRVDDGGTLVAQPAGVTDLAEAPSGEHDVVRRLARGRPGPPNEPQRIGREEVVDDLACEARFDHSRDEDEGFVPRGVRPVLAVHLVDEGIPGQAVLDGEPVPEFRRGVVFEEGLVGKPRPSARWTSSPVCRRRFSRNASQRSGRILPGRCTASCEASASVTGVLWSESLR